MKFMPATDPACYAGGFTSSSKSWVLASLASSSPGVATTQGAPPFGSQPPNRLGAPHRRNMANFISRSTLPAKAAECFLPTCQAIGLPPICPLLLSRAHLTDTDGRDVRRRRVERVVKASPTCSCQHPGCPGLLSLRDESPMTQCSNRLRQCHGLADAELPRQDPSSMTSRRRQLAVASWKGPKRPACVGLIDIASSTKGPIGPSGC